MILIDAKQIKLYEARAYRWVGAKYELSCLYAVLAESNVEARSKLVKALGKDWKASEAREITYSENLPLEKRLELCAKLGFEIIKEGKCREE